MIYGFIAVMAFIVFLVSSSQRGADHESDEFNKQLINSNSELKSEIEDLNSELEKPDWQRMEISEQELYSIRLRLTRKEKRCKLQQAEIKMLKELLKAVRNK